jgi:hypothetical protein
MLPIAAAKLAWSAVTGGVMDRLRQVTARQWLIVAAVVLLLITHLASYQHGKTRATAKWLKREAAAQVESRRLIDAEKARAAGAIAAAQAQLDADRTASDEQIEALRSELGTPTPRGAEVYVGPGLSRVLEGLAR